MQEGHEKGQDREHRDHSLARKYPALPSPMSSSNSKASDFPTLSREQVRELDRIAIEELGLPGVVLMENAGRGAAREVLHAFESRCGDAGCAPARALILCGAGNNGGDGYVVARHLCDAGVDVTLLETAPPERLSKDAAVFRGVCEAMGIRA